MTEKTLLQHLPKGLVQHGVNNIHQLQDKLNHIIQTGQMPDYGYTDFEIQYFINYLCAMDSNNFSNKMGVGEREGRVYSSLVQQRYYGLSHGQGWSGNLTEIQPKATGSSVLQIITHKMLRNLLKQIGLKNTKKLIIYPFATGMALTQCFLMLKSQKKQADTIVILRIDQKTCYKCIEAAGMNVISIDNVLNENKQLETDYAKLIEILYQDQQDKILCVMSISSCFSPRQPDDIIQIGQICRKYNKYHVVNNAYGIQCAQTTKMIQKCMEQNLADLYVSSTDKNFMVPVGGSLVYSQDKKLIEKLKNLYPGRCTINVVLDMFITLLSMGKNTYIQLIKKRQQNQEYLYSKLKEISIKINEEIIESPWNKISIAITLKNIKDNATSFGSQLFHRGVMGAWVVCEQKDVKKIQDIQLRNFGSHLDNSQQMLPYLTVASAIGTEIKEIDDFIQTFEKLYCKILKQQNKIN